MQALTLTINHCKIRYKDTGGSGPVVLFTHGIGGSLETWDALLPSLSQNYRCITWDFPGHGLSENYQKAYSAEQFAQLAWELLNALDVKEASLVGNSLGACTSVLMSELQPERTLRLALLNSAGLGQEAPLPFRLMTLPLLGNLMSKPGKMAIDQQINAIFYDSAAISDTMKQVIERNVLREGGQQAFLQTVRQATHFSGQNKTMVGHTLAILRSIEIPVLFIHGRQDAVIPVEHSEKAQAITPHSSLLIFEDCGHTPQVEKPEQLKQELNQFFVKTSEPALEA